MNSNIILLKSIIIINILIKITQNLFDKKRILINYLPIHVANLIFIFLLLFSNSLFEYMAIQGTNDWTTIRHTIIINYTLFSWKKTIGPSINGKIVRFYGKFNKILKTFSIFFFFCFLVFNWKFLFFMFRIFVLKLIYCLWESSCKGLKH